jgi:hypothetical protein
VGAQAAGTDDSGQIIAEGAPVSSWPEARITESGDHRFFAGWRSDPFFFDVPGARNDLQFTGEDFFADKDVCSIVLEVPNSALAPRRLGLWARTVVSTGDKWVQVDRGALPAQAVFLVGTKRDAYLAGEPADDARFVGEFAHALEHAVDMRRMRRDGSQRRSCQRSCPMIRLGLRPFRLMDGRSPTTRAMLFWRSLQTGR